MANTYKNAAVVMTSTGATDLYSCPANTRAIVQSVNVANVDGSDRYVTVTWFDSSTAQNYTLLFNGFIPAGTALNALDVPLVLEPGDIVRVQASAANTLHATASILQSDPTSAIVDQSVTTAKLADLSVTSTKMATGVSPTIICTSSTRPASPFEGQTIYETDTKKEFTYTGSAWTESALFRTANGAVVDNYRVPPMVISQGVNTSQSVNNVTDAILQWTTAPTTDTNAFWATGANTRFTCGASGIYQVNAGWQVNSNALTGMYIGILRNGSGIITNGTGSPVSQNGVSRIAVSCMVSVTAGQYLEVVVWQNSGAGRTPYAAHFSAAWLGQVS